ncbi:unnamed protein product, partial [Discosporangium mesarthrocarpum]
VWSSSWGSGLSNCRGQSRVQDGDRDVDWGNGRGKVRAGAQAGMAKRHEQAICTVIRRTVQLSQHTQFPNRPTWVLSHTKCLTGRNGFKKRGCFTWSRKAFS